MFKIVDKMTGEVLTVYGINGTHFLIYDEKMDCWKYYPMNIFRPLED